MFILRIVIKEVEIYKYICNITLTFIRKNVFKKLNVMKVCKMLLKS